MRSRKRQTDPLHMWKMSTVDAVAQQNWEEYTKYKTKMFRATSTPCCPWVVVEGNDKDVARMEAMRYVVSQMDYPKKGSAAERLEPDPAIVEVLTNAEEVERYLASQKGISS